jgi:hypothetical protein
MCASANVVHSDNTGLSLSFFHRRLYFIQKVIRVRCDRNGEPFDVGKVLRRNNTLRKQFVDGFFRQRKYHPNLADSISCVGELV